MALDPSLGNEDYCYLTTKGRTSGHDHTIEIWFGIEGETLYMLSGGRDRSDWVRNLQRAPDVMVRIGETHFVGRGRIVAEEHEGAIARRLLVDKYTPRYSGSLTDWGRNALPVAVDLVIEG